VPKETNLAVIIEGVSSWKVLPSHDTNRGNRIPDMLKTSKNRCVKTDTPCTEEVDPDIFSAESILEKLCRIVSLVALIGMGLEIRV
jgi:hypothetical protein